MSYRTNAPARSLALLAALAAASTLAIRDTASAVVLPHASAVQNVRSDVRALTFTTLNNDADPTFNQLLGINDSGVISGYYGSGAPGHPNVGYTIVAPYGQSNYTIENFPGAVQTQVTALNNHADTAGFWVDGNGNNFGFVEWNGVFTSYKDRRTHKGTVNQILGLNDSGTAVGFYTDATGVNHGFELNQATGMFRPIVPPGGANVTATGINDEGDVTGFLTAASGATVGFILKNRTFTEFQFPQADATTPFGINKADQVVGSYVDASGGTHGFILSHPLTMAKWRSVDDPNGVGTTIVNGLNDMGQYVGFYVDAAGNTDGFLAM